VICQLPVVKEQKQIIENEIQELRTTINNHLDKLQDDLMKELTEAEKQAESKVQDPVLSFPIWNNSTPSLLIKLTVLELEQENIIRNNKQRPSKSNQTIIQDRQLSDEYYHQNSNTWRSCWVTCVSASVNFFIRFSCNLSR
jgi:hypothetical protein